MVCLGVYGLNARRIQNRFQRVAQFARQVRQKFFFDVQGVFRAQTVFHCVHVEKNYRQHHYQTRNRRDNNLPITFFIKRLIVHAQNHVPIVVGLCGKNRALLAVQLRNKTVFAVRLNNLIQNAVVVGQVHGNFFADQIRVAVADYHSAFCHNQRFAITQLVHAVNQILHFGKVEVESNYRLLVGQHLRHGVARYAGHCVDIRFAYVNLPGIFRRAFVPQSFLRAIVVGHVEVGNYRPIFSRNINVKADAARQIFLFALAPVKIFFHVFARCVALQKLFGFRCRAKSRTFRHLQRPLEVRANYFKLHLPDFFRLVRRHLKHQAVVHRYHD